jgi:hypothetical protein
MFDSFKQSLKDVAEVRVWSSVGVLWGSVVVWCITSTPVVGTALRRGTSLEVRMSGCI